MSFLLDLKAENTHFTGRPVCGICEERIGKNKGISIFYHKRRKLFFHKQNCFARFKKQVNEINAEGIL